MEHQRAAHFHRFRCAHAPVLRCVRQQEAPDQEVRSPPVLWSRPVRHQDPVLLLQRQRHSRGAQFHLQVLWTWIRCGCNTFFHILGLEKVKAIQNTDMVLHRCGRVFRCFISPSEFLFLVHRCTNAGKLQQHLQKEEEEEKKKLLWRCFIFSCAMFSFLGTSFSAHLVSICVTVCTILWQKGAWKDI